MLFLRILGKGERDHMTQMELLKCSEVQNLNIKKRRKHPDSQK